jgi:hypothetical protein
MKDLSAVVILAALIVVAVATIVSAALGLRNGGFKSTATQWRATSLFVLHGCSISMCAR